MWFEIINIFLEERTKGSWDLEDKLGQKECFKADYFNKKLFKKSLFLVIGIINEGLKTVDGQLLFDEFYCFREQVQNKFNFEVVYLFWI